MYIRLFQTPALVVSSVEIANELMEKRGAIYSDRPPLVLFNEL